MTSIDTPRIKTGAVVGRHSPSLRGALPLRRKASAALGGSALLISR